jgi:hypothetical protein
MTEHELRQRARRAYERGRLRHAALRAGLVLPLAGLVHVAGTALAAAALGTLALAGATLLFLWRGGESARGLRAGLLAGLGPFTLPLLSRASGLMCSQTVCMVLPLACVAGGLLGGALLSGAGFRPEPGRRGFWPAALATTAAAGVLGCIWAGAAGLLGLAVGLTAGAAPLLLRRA